MLVYDQFNLFCWIDLVEKKTRGYAVHFHKHEMSIDNIRIEAMHRQIHECFYTQQLQICINRPTYILIMMLICQQHV